MEENRKKRRKGRGKKRSAEGNESWRGRYLLRWIDR